MQKSTTNIWKNKNKKIQTKTKNIGKDIGFPRNPCGPVDPCGALVQDLSSWIATGQVLDSWTATGHVQNPTCCQNLHALAVEITFWDDFTMVLNVFSWEAQKHLEKFKRFHVNIKSEV